MPSPINPDGVLPPDTRPSTSSGSGPSTSGVLPPGTSTSTSTGSGPSTTG
eukprot:CAMPEP_0172366568 /NCGR_PEP_ID=MMETSP1060-20121228/16149_1 /TAXON_ID=37318 /ORGANISM="Pseudo-nitzschia pungens, Strain cf. cingulata" /LENGTH=49 /DNA_ID= /DNA_START= /DNA_END= /DNA_ORIENTATION=